MVVQMSCLLEMCTQKSPRRLPEAGKEKAMKIFTIIGGVNGCGKSSLTGSLKAERTDLGIIVDPDKLTAELAAENPALLAL